MLSWRLAPASPWTRFGISFSAAALASLCVVAGGAAFNLSRGPAARASVLVTHGAAPLRLRPVLVASTPTATAPVLALQALTPEQALAANQAMAFSTLPNPAAKPFSMKEASEEDQARAETCLAQAVYYEAGFEPLTGEQAVAQVVLNRVRHPVYPKTVCGVVFQGSELPTGCQFTFTCDGALDRTPEPTAWARAQAVAKAALDGYVMKAVGEATHYHTEYVAPYWSASLVKLVQVGQHIFYRWTGTFGQPPAFAGQYAGNEPGAAVPVAPQLTPLEPLAVVYTASKVTAGPSPAAAPQTPAPSDGAEQAKAEVAPAAPVTLAQDTPPAVQAETPKVATVNPGFSPSEGMVPRPKWRPF